MYARESTLSDESDEDEDEDEDEEDQNDLEMDTLNKNSQGRGGWKMLGSGEGQPSHPGSPATPTSPRSNHTTAVKPGGIAKANNFEKFTIKEILAMCVPLLLVTALTGIALHICFVG